MAEIASLCCVDRKISRKQKALFYPWGPAEFQLGVACTVVTAKENPPTNAGRIGLGQSVADNGYQYNKTFSMERPTTTTSQTSVRLAVRLS